MDEMKTPRASLIPGVLVFVTLAGAAVWGYRTDWKWHRSHTEAADDLHHSDHNGGLLFAEFDDSAGATEWCDQHGIVECVHCHPERAQVDRSPTDAGSPSDERSDERQRIALSVWRRDENDPHAIGAANRIRVVSREAATLLGCDVAPAWENSMMEFVSVSGQVSYDANRVARLSSRVPGIAWRVRKQVGDPVAAGDVLAFIESEEITRAKGDYLQAMLHRKSRAATAQQLATAPVSQRQKHEAQSALRDANVRVHSAEQLLIHLGLPVRTEAYGSWELEQLVRELDSIGLPDDIGAGEGEGVIPTSLWPLRSPLAGTVTEVNVVAGEVVEKAERLFVVADPSQMWVTLSVDPADVPWIRLGLPVSFLPDGSHQPVRGTLAWVGTSADPKTRAIPLRAEFANVSGNLRAGALGEGKIILREEPRAITVPREAINTVGNSRVVFVRDKQFLRSTDHLRFHARMVRVGAIDETNAEILAGIVLGEVVVTKGSGVLAAELRRYQSVTLAERDRWPPSRTVTDPVPRVSATNAPDADANHHERQR